MKVGTGSGNLDRYCLKNTPQKPSREPHESIAADPGILRGDAPTRRGQPIVLPIFPDQHS